MTTRILMGAALGIFCITLSGCEGGEAPADAGPNMPEGTVEFDYATVMDLPACDTENVKAYPDHRCHTYRALAGASMGGGTSGRIGFRHPELFDVVGIMGTPFADSEFFWNMIQEDHMGGFCPLEDLEALMRSRCFSIGEQRPSGSPASCCRRQRMLDV